VSAVDSIAIYECSSIRSSSSASLGFRRSAYVSHMIAEYRGCRGFVVSSPGQCVAKAIRRRGEGWDYRRIRRNPWYERRRIRGRTPSCKVAILSSAAKVVIP
jgi:hypothetical protein